MLATSVSVQMQNSTRIITFPVGICRVREDGHNVPSISTVESLYTLLGGFMGANNALQTVAIQKVPCDVGSILYTTPTRTWMNSIRRSRITPKKTL
jgi:hypothetical protein